MDHALSSILHALSHIIMHFLSYNALTIYDHSILSNVEEQKPFYDITAMSSFSLHHMRHYDFIPFIIFTMLSLVTWYVSS